MGVTELAGAYPTAENKAREERWGWVGEGGGGWLLLVGGGGGGVGVGGGLQGAAAQTGTFLSSHCTLW